MLLRHQDLPGSVAGPSVRRSGVAATLAFALALAVGGCGTMRGAPPQRIVVSTYPPGAECTLINRSTEGPAIVAMTPGEVEVHRSNSPLEVRCAKYGHLDAVESYESFVHNDSPTSRRQVVAAETLLRESGSIEIAQSGAVKEEAAAPPTTVAATAAPSLDGNVALAAVDVGLAVLNPVAFIVNTTARVIAGTLRAGMTSPAVFKYPAAVMLILPPVMFADESSRAAYYAEVDRQFDVAREALRTDTASRCLIFGCDVLSREDDTYIASWRSRVAATRSRTTIAVSELPSPPTPPEQ